MGFGLSFAWVSDAIVCSWCSSGMFEEMIYYAPFESGRGRNCERSLLSLHTYSVDRQLLQRGVCTHVFHCESFASIGNDDTTLDIECWSKSREAASLADVQSTVKHLSLASIYTSRIIAI